MPHAAGSLHPHPTWLRTMNVSQQQPAAPQQAAAAVPGVRQLKAGLYLLRPIQVLLSLIGFIVSAMALSELSRAVSLVRRGRASLVLPDGMEDDAETEAALLWVLRSAIAVTAVVMVLFLATIGLALALLVLAGSPRLRARATCCGRHRAAFASYGADAALDAGAAAVWLVAFILACVYAGGLPGVLALSALLLASFAGSFTLSWLVRRRLHAAAGGGWSVTEADKTAAGLGQTLAMHGI